MPRFGERHNARAVAKQLAREPRPRPADMRPPMIGRMLDAQKRERELIVREFVQVKGLMPLLMKHRNGGRWTREERVALQEQLQALAHLSPYLVVLAMPGSFVILPVLAWWLDRRRHQRPGPRLDAPT